MARYLFRILVVLSSLLLGASVAMWARSEWTREIWTRVHNRPLPRDERGWSAEWTSEFVASGDGVVRVGRSCGTLRGLTAGPFGSSQRIVRTPWNHRAGPYAIPSSAIPSYAKGFSAVGLSVRWWRPTPPLDGSYTGSDTEIEISYWLVALLACVLPVAWAKGALRDRARRRRVRRGLCTACGYDLRGSADRCPECGAARTSSP
jgi:hypothetical protein